MLLQTCLRITIVLLQDTHFLFPPTDSIEFKYLNWELVPSAVKVAKGNICVHNSRVTVHG